MPSNNILNLIAKIGSQQGLTPAQIKAMQATSRVESTLNPKAVGDNGTSYGLFQHHVGGAGGKTHAEAQRFLNPTTSITERAKWFKKNNITSGAGAAALQRPADPKGYAVKVDNALKGMPAELNAPIDSSVPAADDSAAPPSQVSSSPSFASTYLKGYLGYDKDPVMSSLYDSFYANKQEAETPKTSTSTTTKTSDQPTGTKGKLGDYKDIVELAKKWGLNIQGDFQTTGGRHAPNSRHYAGKAADFGDATNSPERMKQFAAYLARNAGTYGINNLYYTPLGWSLEGQSKTKKTIGGHGDHLHVDVF